MYAERHTRKRLFLAFWLFVLSAISFLDRTNISIAGLQISSEYGLGNQRLGWIFSAFLIGYAGFQVPAGWLASRFGPRLVITLGVVWWGVATALTTLIPPGISQAVVLLIGIRFAAGRRGSCHLPGSQPVRGPLGAGAGTRVHQRADLCRSGRGERSHAPAAGVVYSASRLAVRVLVQRRDRRDRGSGVVVVRPGYSGRRSQSLAVRTEYSFGRASRRVPRRRARRTRLFPGEPSCAAAICRR